jgi:5'-methylthioadenosine phosphorylase
MMKVELAIIGGTGFYHPEIIENTEELSLKTPYGDTHLLVGTYMNTPVAFLSRHGMKHGVPPHRVNYRANISALKDLGVKRVLATTAVGSLRKKLSPGTMVITDQFIDFTKGRDGTFYEGEDSGGVVHTDFSEPYCGQLRKYLIKSIAARGIDYASKGTYICTEGPRYETPAEIKAFALWGADVVGMTGVPEATLAREAGLCYANLSLITNYAAGISPHILTHREVVEMMEKKINLLREIILEVLVALPEARECNCWKKEDYSLGQ